LRSGHPSLIGDLSRRTRAQLPRGGWDVSPSSAVVLPIFEGEVVRGGVVVGLNPFRPWDDDYAAFLDLVAAQVTATIAEIDARLIREISPLSVASAVSSLAILKVPSC